jgi:mannose-6-phosphate isomerase-like protein (cupin superfamily)
MSDSQMKEAWMAELKVVNIKDVKGERRDPPRVSWVLVSEKTVGAQNLAMGVNETYPGGMVPEHKHEKEEEVMFFLAGRGTFVTEDREIPLEPGVCVYNPPGKTHKILNTGSEVLRFVWIYAPQLPQHRVQK